MITFDDSTHTYYKDGLIKIPSVSELIRFATNESYGSVPQSILDAAAEFGTEIHSAIQDYIETGTETDFLIPTYQNSFGEFLRLKDEFLGKENSMEQIIDYDEKYAGRYDLISDGVLIDFKTNAKFDERLETHLRWQMGYYKMALNFKGIEIKSCQALWLPKKGKGSWHEIRPIDEDTLLSSLIDYETKKREEWSV